MQHPTVVVPLRAGKSRLGDRLSRDALTSLRHAMFADVVGALRGAGVQRVLVAAGDQESASVARALQVPFRLDPPEVGDLDGAVAAAAAAARRLGEDLAVVHADLPALSAEDVEVLLATPGQVVLAPTSDGGTGALLRRPVTALETAYGPESAALHAARALDAGILPAIVERPGFELDVDTPEDLERLVVVDDVGRHTRTWLRDHRGGGRGLASPGAA